MKLKLKSDIENNKEFQNIIKDLIENDTVNQMKFYRQHYNTSCYEHCYIVSYYCYLICKRHNLDYISATRAGMLHDLFLYDWREKSTEHSLHAFKHRKVACKNACELFELNEKEKDMIIKHMWPLTVKIPNSKEGFILTLVDKYCAILESLEGMKNNLIKSKMFRYAYLMLFIIIFKK